ncbi:hypothetical protein PVMG_04427, partial [Plasmodium vivax Mauritania I]
ILLTLSPVLGIIFPAFFLENSLFSNLCASDCKGSPTEHTHEADSGTFYKTQYTKAEWDLFFYFNMVFFFTLCIIALTVIIYTLVKVVKYERLKAGKGKMNRNEYFKYCKEVFNL